MPEIRLKLPKPGKVSRSYPAWLEWPRYVVPYRFRRVHRWWAHRAPFFWLPCPLCGEEFGGHEWRDIGGLPSRVPDPMNQPASPSGPVMSVGICPACTRAGRGVEDQ